MRFVVKVLLVVALMGAGIWMLLARTGLLVQHVSYKGFDAWGLPVGVCLVIIGAVVLCFWRLHDETVTSTSTSRGGAQTVVTRTTRTSRNYLDKR
jgi:hypothetical protein